MLFVRVALDIPLPRLFDYRYECECTPSVGDRVIVPFGKRQLIGVVISHTSVSDFPAEQIRPITAVLKDVPPLPADWLAFASFAAKYYQRPLGEVIMASLPAALRTVAAYTRLRHGGGPVLRLQKRLQNKHEKAAKLATVSEQLVPNAGVTNLLEQPIALDAPTLPQLNAAQSAAVQALAQTLGSYAAVLLFGVTGSGKTEVYLHQVRQVLDRGDQVLILVPEINLTPQLTEIFQKRFANDLVVCLHSGLSEGERLSAWLAAYQGQAKVILGTRLAIFAPLPRLALIVVDEEHDPSYKQQEGLRYSARDLALWLGKQKNIPVVLGSATPSLESWRHAQAKRFQLLTLPERASAESLLPQIKLIDTRRLKLDNGLSMSLLDSIQQRLAKGEQSLIFLNRRGYAPILQCTACTWVQSCPRCSVYMVLHRHPIKKTGQAAWAELHCHHCGLRGAAPTACPDCGNQDLKAMGRGTQRVEEHLAERFPQARIARIDADSTRRKGSAAELFAQVHRGDIDILVGTQMVAKGHDFRSLTLVGAINPDSMLFSQDFRAPERLFSQLMQVAGRAGRSDKPGEVFIQTAYPEHSLYKALMAHDYPQFAAATLQEREQAGLPPFSYQALLRAEAKTIEAALAYLHWARELEVELETALRDEILLYDPIPLNIVRVAHVERAQLLIESRSRSALQTFLGRWLGQLYATKTSVRWQVEVDPQHI